MFVASNNSLWVINSGNKKLYQSKIGTCIENEFDGSGIKLMVGRESPIILTNGGNIYATIGEEHSQVIKIDIENVDTIGIIGDRCALIISDKLYISERINDMHENILKNLKELPVHSKIKKISFCSMYMSVLAESGLYVYGNYDFTFYDYLQNTHFEKYDRVIDMKCDPFYLALIVKDHDDKIEIYCSDPCNSFSFKIFEYNFSMINCKFIHPLRDPYILSYMYEKTYICALVWFNGTLKLADEYDGEIIDCVYFDEQMYYVKKDIILREIYYPKNRLEVDDFLTEILRSEKIRKMKNARLII